MPFISIVCVLASGEPRRRINLPGTSFMLTLFSSELAKQNCSISKYAYFGINFTYFKSRFFRYTKLFFANTILVVLNLLQLKFHSNVQLMILIASMVDTTLVSFRWTLKYATVCCAVFISNELLSGCAHLCKPQRERQSETEGQKRRQFTTSFDTKCLHKYYDVVCK